MDLRTIVDCAEATFALAASALIVGLARRRRRDRVTIRGLERAFAGHSSQLPGIAIGSSVCSASPGARLGGDIVDVFELDARYAMLLVADVSGKGLDAAAQTAFIKYTLRTLALENDGDPAVVVAKFNAIYRRTVTNDEAFVVLILGIVDSQTGDVRYASAGHEPAFVRRSTGAIRQLAPTGPIVGVSPYSAYRSDSVLLGAGDVLIWTTDGITESRDKQRRLLGADGLAAWIAAAPPDVAGIAKSLQASLRRRSGGVVHDDAAVLAVAYTGATVRNIGGSPLVERYESLLGELRDRRSGRSRQ